MRCRNREREFRERRDEQNRLDENEAEDDVEPVSRDQTPLAGDYISPSLAPLASLHLSPSASLFDPESPWPSQRRAAKLTNLSRDSTPALSREESTSSTHHESKAKDDKAKDDKTRDDKTRDDKKKYDREEPHQETHKSSAKLPSDWEPKMWAPHLFMLPPALPPPLVLIALFDFSSASGKTYYYNKRTNQSAWNLPDDVKSSESGSFKQPESKQDKSAASSWSSDDKDKDKGKQEKRSRDPSPRSRRDNDSPTEVKRQRTLSPSPSHQKQQYPNKRSQLSAEEVAYRHMYNKQRGEDALDPYESELAGRRFERAVEPSFTAHHGQDYTFSTRDRYASLRAGPLEETFFTRDASYRDFLLEPYDLRSERNPYYENRSPALGGQKAPFGEFLMDPRYQREDRGGDRLDYFWDPAGPAAFEDDRHYSAPRDDRDVTMRRDYRQQEDKRGWKDKRDRSPGDWDHRKDPDHRREKPKKGNNFKVMKERKRPATKGETENQKGQGEDNAAADEEAGPKTLEAPGKEVPEKEEEEEEEVAPEESEDISELLLAKDSETFEMMKMSDPERIAKTLEEVAPHLLPSLLGEKLTAKVLGLLVDNFRRTKPHAIDQYALDQELEQAFIADLKARLPHLHDAGNRLTPPDTISADIEWLQRTLLTLKSPEELEALVRFFFSFFLFFFPGMGEN